MSRAFAFPLQCDNFTSSVRTFGCHLSKALPRLPMHTLRAIMSWFSWPDAATPLRRKFRRGSEALWQEERCLDGLGRPAKSYINPLQPPFVDHHKLPITSITISFKAPCNRSAEFIILLSHVSPISGFRMYLILILKAWNDHN